MLSRTQTLFLGLMGSVAVSTGYVAMFSDENPQTKGDLTASFNNGNAAVCMLYEPLKNWLGVQETGHGNDAQTTPKTSSNLQKCTQTATARSFTQP